MKVAQSCPTLWSPGLYNPWNSPSQNTGVGSLSLLQGIFPALGSNPGLPHCRWFFTSWITRKAKEYWSGSVSQSVQSLSHDLPNTGIKPGSPALRVDFLPTELWGKPTFLHFRIYSQNTALRTVQWLFSLDAYVTRWTFKFSLGKIYYNPLLSPGLAWWLSW